MKRQLCRCEVLLISAVFALIVGVLVSSPAFAAGPQAATYSWEGMYVGAHFGYGWGNADTTVASLPEGRAGGLTTETMSNDPKGILGGVQVGYNYQTGILVIGAETDFSLADMKGTANGPIVMDTGLIFPGGNIQVQQRTNWFGTLRLRAGVTPTPKLLLYATGGLAYGQVKYSANINVSPFYPAATTKTKAGWTAGAGAEYAMTRNWSVKAEYLYYNLGNETIIGNPNPVNPPWQIKYESKTSANIVRIGLNYKF